MRTYRFRGGQRGKQGKKHQQPMGRGRPPKEIVIESHPEVKKVNPEPKLSKEEIHLTLGEFEALRLIDYEDLNQEEAGEKMHVSRGTIWRLLDSGRLKLMKLIIEGKTLVIESHLDE
jgi:predicted DNA-binding protein (UPF0251 family)